MSQSKQSKTKHAANQAKDKATQLRDGGARKKVLEELFNDFYSDRFSVYLFNFIRGVFFGFGSVIGGTIVVALFIWVLSFFTDIPGIGHSFEQLKHAVDSAETTK